MRPKLGRLRRGDPRRRGVRLHHRRPPPAQPAARALHRRRHRHQGDAVSGDRAGTSASSRCGVEARYAMPTYARAPVEFVRGEGTTHLGLGGQRVHRPVQRALGPQRRPLPPGDRRRDRRPGSTASGAAPTSTTRSRRCGCRSGSSESSLGGRSFLCNSGAEANECAIKLVRKHAPRPRHRSARDRRPRERLPRPHARRPRGDASSSPARTSSARCRQGSSAVPRDDPEALRRRGRPGTPPR